MRRLLLVLSLMLGLSAVPSSRSISLIDQLIISCLMWNAVNKNLSGVWRFPDLNGECFSRLSWHQWWLMSLIRADLISQCLSIWPLRSIRLLMIRSLITEHLSVRTCRRFIHQQRPFPITYWSWIDRPAVFVNKRVSCCHWVLIASSIPGAVTYHFNRLCLIRAPSDW